MVFKPFLLLIQQRNPSSVKTLNGSLFRSVFKKQLERLTTAKKFSRTQNTGSQKMKLVPTPQKFLFVSPKFYLSPKPRFGERKRVYQKHCFWFKGFGEFLGI